MFLDVILHFDMAALFIFAIIIFYVIYRKLYKAYSSFVFLLINILYFVLCSVDIIVSSNIIPNLYVNEALMFIYYLLKYQISIVYLLYLIVITHSEDLIRNKRVGIPFSIPFIVTFGYLISNLFTGQIYYFNSSGEYFRGDYIFLFYGLSFVYVLIGIIWLIYNAKMFVFSDIFALSSVYVFSIAALVIQYFFKDVVIEILATSLSMLLLSSTVERSRFVVDPRTGLKNNNNFAGIVFSSFKRKKEVGVVLFYIKNYLAIYDKYRYDVAIRNSRILSSYLSKAFVDKYKYDCYYLNGGIYAFVTEPKNIEEFSLSLNQLLESTYDKKVDFNINYVICNTIIPNDFSNQNEFDHFVYSFVDSVNTNKKVISVADIKKNNNNQLINLDLILDRAIVNKEIVVEYQPLYELSERKFTVVEALARINDPEFGIINADNFISYAEKKDRIYELDMAIIDRVYDFYSTVDFDDMGLKCISINLSVQTLCNKNFHEDLKLLELKYGVKKRKIYFEIKERERTTFNQNAFDSIKALMDEGYLFSLDNYGIGCMPIDNLAKVPFVNVKFDTTFAKACVNKDTCIVIGNTIKLFKNLNKVSICAGVDDEESAKILEGLNPDYVQGFYYSRPLSLDNLVAFLMKHNK